MFVHTLIERSMTLSARDAIKHFNIRLREKLPLDDNTFCVMVKEADLFPLSTADSIAAQSTRAEKVSYFLQNVVEPGADEYLPKLLGVMKESEDTGVIKLANEMEAAMESGVHAYLHVVHIRMYKHMVPSTCT